MKQNQSIWYRQRLAFLSTLLFLMLPLSLVKAVDNERIAGGAEVTRDTGAKFVSHTLAEPISTDAVADQQAVTLDYWTREMIAISPAMDMPVDMGETDIESFSLDEEVDTGSAGKVLSGIASPSSNRVHEEAYSEDWAALNYEDWGAIYVDSLNAIVENDDVDGSTLDMLGDEMVGTRNVYSDYPVNERTALWKLYPHKWVGKFTFTTSRGNASCSATAIRNNHIVTAAHCVFDTINSNRWYLNKAFTPAYRNGHAPYGTFSTAGCHILKAWKNLAGFYQINSWARHDVAVCKMGNNSAGQTLNQAVGWSGYGWNWGYDQIHFNSGYPARSFSNKLLSSPAQYLRSCTAESFKQTKDTLGSGCEYGRGISGGSWIRGYRPDYVTGWVNSVNSGLFVGKPNLYGARFTSGNIKKLCDESGC